MTGEQRLAEIADRAHRLSRRTTADRRPEVRHACERPSELHDEEDREQRAGALLAVFLVVQLGWALARMADLRAPVGSRAPGEAVSSVGDLGEALFTRHMFAFEATSVLILVAMVGAVVLARRERQ